MMHRALQISIVVRPTDQNSSQQDEAAAWPHIILDHEELVFLEMNCAGGGGVYHCVRS